MANNEDEFNGAIEDELARKIFGDLLILDKLIGRAIVLCAELGDADNLELMQRCKRELKNRMVATILRIEMLGE